MDSKCSKGSESEKQEPTDSDREAAKKREIEMYSRVYTILAHEFLRLGLLPDSKDSDRSEATTEKPDTDEKVGGGAAPAE